MGEVAIIDRVTLRGVDARNWVDQLGVRYLPGARERRMRLTGIWTSHVGEDAVEVCVLWELDTVADFWAMRRAAGNDRTVQEWWDETDALALARHRRVYGAAQLEGGPS